MSYSQLPGGGKKEYMYRYYDFKNILKYFHWLIEFSVVSLASCSCWTKTIITLVLPFSTTEIIDEVLGEHNRNLEMETDYQAIMQ